MSKAKKMARITRPPRKGVSGVDPRQMRIPQKGLVDPAQEREQRMMKLLALRRVARELEKGDLYFLPVETNPLAVMGILQVSDPEGGIDREKSIPWSIPEKFLPLPLMEVPNRVGMYYKVAVIKQGSDAVDIRISRHDIVREPPAEETEKTDEIHGKETDDAG